MPLFMFFLVTPNSSSFSDMRRSISCLTWVSSSWHLSTLFSELLVLLRHAALNLLSHLGQLQLASQHLVLLLLQSSLSLGQSRLQLHLLSLQTSADFVNLVDGASTLADLVHDVLDLIAQGLVLTSDLIQLKD